MTNAPAEIAAAPVIAPIVTLVEPIPRTSGEAITALTLRKPRAGELRGLQLRDLMQSDVNSVLAVLPRIAQPFITDQEAAQLSSEDIAEIGGVIVGFFMSPATKAAIQQMTGGTA